jgi:hypothetical protein
MKRRQRQAASGYVFTWWDDAVAFAQRAADLTGRRQQVRMASPGVWAVSEVGSPLSLVRAAGIDPRRRG